MRLDKFNASGFDRGASRIVEALWVAAGSMLLASSLPGSGWRRNLLRLFGARVAPNAVIKQRVRVKFPWRLDLGAHCWVGEAVWIDNLATVTLGSHSCVSQGTYLCTGSHDWNRETFDLIVGTIEIGPHAWVGSRCNIAPGTIVGEGAVVVMGSTARGTLAPWTRHAGHFAVQVGPRLRPANPASDG